MIHKAWSMNSKSIPLYIKEQEHLSFYVLCMLMVETHGMINQVCLPLFQLFIMFSYLVCMCRCVCVGKKTTHQSWFSPLPCGS